MGGLDLWRCCRCFGRGLREGEVGAEGVVDAGGGRGAESGDGLVGVGGVGDDAEGL